MGVVGAVRAGGPGRRGRQPSARLAGSGAGGARGAPVRRAVHGGGAVTAVLRASGVSVSFGGVDALAGLDLEVGERELVGLIGPNGAGKTTTFNVISGFYAPTVGQVFYRDKDISGLKTALAPWIICVRR